MATRWTDIPLKAEEEKTDAVRKGIAIVRVLEYHICGNEYELKSQNGALGNKIADGADETMIAALPSERMEGRNDIHTAL